MGFFACAKLVLDGAEAPHGRKSGSERACGEKVSQSETVTNMPKAYLNGFTEGETLGAIDTLHSSTTPPSRARI